MTGDYIPTPQPVGFIHLGSLCVCVVKHYADDYSQKTLDYFPAQALVQWAQQDWDSAQVALQAENMRCLYGIREFITPDILGVTVAKDAQLYLRLDRSQRYLAHLISERLAADSVELHAAQQALQWQADWDQALAQYQHQQRALMWWQRCGLEEITEPGINERRRQQRQSKPTMIHELSGHGRNRPHSHSHSHHCLCHRSRNHTHGHF